MKEYSRIVITITSFSLFLACISPFCAGQRLAIGVAGGAGVTNDFPTSVFLSDVGGPGIINYSTPKRYLIGAMLGIELTKRFSIEVDGLYRPLELTFANVFADGSRNSVSPATVVTWEFPVLAKYRVHLPRVSPFIEAGPSFRATGNLNGTSPSHFGVTGGLGFEMHAGGINIAPVARYTRWAPENRLSGALVSDQVELIVGLSHTAKGLTEASMLHPLGARVSLGAVVGMTLTPDFRDASSSLQSVAVGGQSAPPSVTSFSSAGPRSVLWGATIQIDVVRRLSIEIEALHRPMQFHFEQRCSASSLNCFNLTSTGTVAGWEFPALAKYTFGDGRMKPFAEAGPAFRLPNGLNDASHYGVNGGVGIETRLGPINIAPVVRYTRWAPDHPAGASGAIRNEAELLVAFRF